jgi:hypothetical protein
VLLPVAIVVVYSEPRGSSTHEAFRPIGLTLIIPFLNSMKVPLRVSRAVHRIGDISCTVRFIDSTPAEGMGTHRLMGISISAM